MKILYSLLKEINNKTLDNGEKLYSMKEYEFRELLRYLYDNDYIKGGIILSDCYSLKSSTLTDKGFEILEKYKEYEINYPKRENLSKWIRSEVYSYNENSYTYKKLNSKLNKENLLNSLEEFIGIVEKIYNSNIKLNVSEVATNSEVKEVEERLGFPLPEEFKRVLLKFSKEVKFHWSIDENIEIEENKNFKHHEYNTSSETIKSEISSGGNLDNPLWSINNLEELEDLKETYEFIDEDYPKAYWSNSMIFQGLGNGEYLGIDLLYNPGEVILLSTNSYLNGWPIANNFISFINEWFKVGCIGNLDKDFYLLSSNKAPYISHKSSNSIKINKKLISLTQLIK